MRGRLGNYQTIFGDIYYDYSKIYQSILGYDFVLNSIELDYEYIDTFRENFENRFTKNELENIEYYILVK